MQTMYKPLLAIAAVAIPVFAGAMYLEIGDPAGNPEAKAQQAVLVARTTACKSPEKTTIRGTAEGMVNGVRKSIPLALTPLSKGGTFAVKRQWPETGTWVIELVATNPDYQNYATSVLAPYDKGAVQFSAAKHLWRSPSDADVMTFLSGEATTVRSSLH